MFRKISEGDVFLSADERKTSGPRLAILPDGDLICTFMLNKKSGANAFTPMAAWSRDGERWSEAKELYPELTGKKSTFVSVRNTHDGRLILAGKQWNIDDPDESFWSDEVGGMKENRLAFSISDDGRHFPPLQLLELPFYASAEEPGGALVDPDGTIRIIYAPYKTIEQRASVDTCFLGYMVSRDGGKSFTGEKIGVIPAPCLYAESWLDRLSDGRLFISTWQTQSEDSSQFLLSSDGGKTFTGPYAQPFRGQSTGICPGRDGEVYIVYNQRKEEPKGVWLALEKPTEKGAGLLANEPIWVTEQATKTGTSGDFAQFTDFSFGEPHVKLLPDGTLLVVLWYQQGERKGVRYVRLARD